MPSSRGVLALAAAVSSASAAYQGFNYGSTFTDGSFKAQSDYESDFKTAAGLDGTNGGFTSARLYTMIQGGSTSDPIAAIPAAIKTKTSLLFGLWASGDGFDNEIAALQKTIDQYCDDIGDLVAGISVGSEDLYRNSPIGIENLEYAGADPDTLVSYIKKVRDTIKGSCISDAPIGHVDTWTAYVNGSNSAVIEACDWLGMDAYPYFENTKPNAIDKGKDLFQSALDKVKGVSGGKDVWITETGWPVSGKTSGDAEPSKENARTYWEQVACPLFGNTNVWWYTLQDAAPTTPNPSFGVIGSDLTTKPIYDLSCDDVDDSTSSTSKESTSHSKTSDAVSSASSADSGSSSDSAATTSSAASNGSATTMSSASSTAAGGSGSGHDNGNSTVGGGSGGSATTAVTSASASSGTGSGSGTTGGSSSSTPSSVPEGGAARLNSFGAAAVGLVLAAAML